ncbi:unnamed protein product [Miscanthus lutarioriparius]|uniref:Uncharacterized protein n=1 Tax=Miscanthus lutarioriparius TaxID=422564 RepID=A0A811QUY6_9POAL|nr:unnamed protein product [Miscanthus lutarioriparius]
MAAATPSERGNLMPPPPPVLPPTAPRPRRRGREVSSRYISTPVPSTPRLSASSAASSTRSRSPTPSRSWTAAGSHALRQREPPAPAAASHGNRRAPAGRPVAFRGDGRRQSARLCGLQLLRRSRSYSAATPALHQRAGRAHRAERVPAPSDARACWLLLPFLRRGGIGRRLVLLVV